MNFLSRQEFIFSFSYLALFYYKFECRISKSYIKCNILLVLWNSDEINSIETIRILKEGKTNRKQGGEATEWGEGRKQGRERVVKLLTH